ncbi:MAG: hypothetical protein AAGC93_03635, partial [Cyanobacteria bacterium P01_F01_bin.53]
SIGLAQQNLPKINPISKALWNLLDVPQGFADELPEVLSVRAKRQCIGLMFYNLFVNPTQPHLVVS